MPASDRDTQPNPYAPPQAQLLGLATPTDSRAWVYPLSLEVDAGSVFPTLVRLRDSDRRGISLARRDRLQAGMTIDTRRRSKPFALEVKFKSLSMWGMDWLLRVAEQDPQTARQAPEAEPPPSSEEEFGSVTLARRRRNPFTAFTPIWLAETKAGVNISVRHVPAVWRWVVGRNAGLTPPPLANLGRQHADLEGLSDAQRGPVILSVHADREEPILVVRKVPPTPLRYVVEHIEGDLSPDAEWLAHQTLLLAFALLKSGAY